MREQLTELTELTERTELTELTIACVYQLLGLVSVSPSILDFSCANGDDGHNMSFRSSNTKRRTLQQ